MTTTQEIDLVKDISDEIIFPNGDIYSNEPPLETEIHLRQIILLWQCLELLWQERKDFYVAGNLTIYYSKNQLKSEDFRGPDLFVVLGTQRKTRKSWVVWEEEGKYPNFILEIISPTTAKTDLGLKLQIYQDTFRTPNYFLYNPYTLELIGFHLVEGTYQPIEANNQGHLRSQQLGLYLGVYEEVLRLFTAEGELVPTEREVAQQAQEKAFSAEQKALSAEQKAELEVQKTLEAQQKAERLAAKLRELNIDPDLI